MMDCVVKISIGSYCSVDEVVYYRSGLSVDFVVRWLWYFEYIASLIKIHNPRKKVTLFHGHQDVLVGKEWHDFRRQSLLKSKTNRLKRLQNSMFDDDLFGFESQERELKIARLKMDIVALEEDRYTFDEFPDYINLMKKYIKRN